MFILLYLLLFILRDYEGRGNKYKVKERKQQMNIPSPLPSPLSLFYIIYYYSREKGYFPFYFRFFFLIPFILNENKISKGKFSNPWNGRGEGKGLRLPEIPKGAVGHERCYFPSLL